MPNANLYPSVAARLKATGVRLVFTSPSHRQGTLIGWIVLSLALFASAARAQNVQYTNNKADQALRSDMRIDPSTLGMSLQIPLGAYPGRGISLPLCVGTISMASRLCSGP